MKFHDPRQGGYNRGYNIFEKNNLFWRGYNVGWEGYNGGGGGEGGIMWEGGYNGGINMFKTIFFFGGLGGLGGVGGGYNRGDQYVKKKNWGGMGGGIMWVGCVRGGYNRGYNVGGWGRGVLCGVW
ncbi:hypothetical protein DPMN_126365 [Dreissena polymorpha]|uniref:Uncharacterized protein n=1 Tax=Dreissena polymorpha TaxID=45954 RepID=A0A9D4GWY9_DREPO|nr:hypothetical protein DPMN_126365 [Dreissena polymorpha]